MRQSEIWKRLPGFDELYIISNKGKIYSVKKRRLLSQSVMTEGYLMCNLWKDKKQTCALVHRMVAIAFLENPKKLPQVNHKDGDKFNNYSSNLEWVTAKKNIEHAIKNGLFRSTDKRLKSV